MQVRNLSISMPPPTQRNTKQHLQLAGSNIHSQSLQDVDLNALLANDNQTDDLKKS